MTLEYEINPLTDPTEERINMTKPRASKFGEWFEPATYPEAERADNIRVIPQSEWQDIIDQRKAAGVSMVDGETALTRIPCGPSSF